MTIQQKKAPHSALLTMGELTQPLAQDGVNTTAVLGQHSTRSAKTESTPPSTTSSVLTSSNLTEKERENALLAAGILASTVPTLLKAGLIRKVRNKDTREVLLAFPSTVWTDDIKLIRGAK